MSNDDKNTDASQSDYTSGVDDGKNGREPSHGGTYVDGFQNGKEAALFEKVMLGINMLREQQQELRDEQRDLRKVIESRPCFLHTKEIAELRGEFKVIAVQAARDEIAVVKEVVRQEIVLLRAELKGVVIEVVREETTIFRDATIQDAEEVAAIVAKKEIEGLPIKDHAQKLAGHSEGIAVIQARMAIVIGALSALSVGALGILAKLIFKI